MYVKPMYFAAVFLFGISRMTTLAAFVFYKLGASLSHILIPASGIMFIASILLAYIQLKNERKTPETNIELLLELRRLEQENQDLIWQIEEMDAMNAYKMGRI